MYIKVIVHLYSILKNNHIPVLPVFADARNNNTYALVTCMLYQKKLNISRRREG